MTIVARTDVAGEPNIASTRVREHLPTEPRNRPKI